MRSDPRDDLRAFMLQEFAAYPRLGLAEAVAQESFAGRLLLPHRHPDVVGFKLIAGVAEVDGVAGRIAAESVVRLLNSAKGYFRQQRFYCLELHRCPAFGTGPARARVGFGTGRVATVVHHIPLSTLKCTSESSALIPSALTADHAPFDEERQAHAHYDETPQGIFIDVPESRLHQKGHARRNEKQRSSTTKAAAQNHIAHGLVQQV